VRAQVSARSRVRGRSREPLAMASRRSVRVQRLGAGRSAATL